MWLDNLFNHLVIDKWQQTDIFSGVAGPGEGLAAADPGLRWGGCSSGGGAAAPTSQLARCPMYGKPFIAGIALARSEEHTSELQSLMRISYAVFCLKKKKITTYSQTNTTHTSPD